MESPYCYKNTIEKAASRVRGDRLQMLYKLCDSQKTISTKKLERLIDELHDSDKQDGIHFKALAAKLAAAERKGV